MNTFRNGSKLKFMVLVIVMLMVTLLGPGSALAAADSFTVSSVFPIDILVFVSCANGWAGEEVWLSGNLHDVFHVTLNSNGGYRVSFSDNPQGIRGVGLTTGAKYQATGITRDNFGGQIGFEETYVNNFKIIGEGPGNNFLVHENFHITFNADGTVTSFHDNFSVECR